MYALADLAAAASVKQAVHDGDTVSAQLAGGFSVRLLGVDAAEVSFRLPHSKAFTSIGSAAWTEFLTDPFGSQYGAFRRLELDGVTAVEGSAKTVLGDGLVQHLTSRLGPDCARNHATHAEEAHRALEDLVQADVDERKQQGRPFEFFLAFAYSSVDRYGRLLAFLHRNDDPAERKRRTSYNERMLADGQVAPYFIWPNVDPFRLRPNKRAAVPPPGALRGWLSGDGKKLAAARAAVKTARQVKVGIFGDANGKGPLALLPFELRYLADRRAPDRYVLDLSKAGHPGQDVLLEPRMYYKISHLEDRLFIDADDVPLFLKAGYVLQTRGGGA